MKAKAATKDRMPHGKDSTTVRLSNADKLELQKFGARLLLKEGKDRTMEEVIHYVIVEFKKTHKDEI